MGSFEQHGDHLPLLTDAIVRLCHREGRCHRLRLARLGEYPLIHTDQRHH
ncbi:hypothetical protein ABGB07_45620 [Micromonosporaceae bacterium B7E4]